MTGASLRGARLAQVQLSGANLEEANLYLVLNLDAALLVDAKLCNTTMPDGLIDNRGC